MKNTFSHGNLCLCVACHKLLMRKKQRRNGDFYGGQTTNSKKS